MDDKSTAEVKRKRKREREREEGATRIAAREMRRISVAQCDSLQTRSRSFSLLSLSLSLSRFFVALADAHVFSSCLPIENRVGDQIEFPTSTSLYSSSGRDGRVAEEKISRDSPRATEMRAWIAGITADCYPFAQLFTLNDNVSPSVRCCFPSIPDLSRTEIYRENAISARLAITR